MSDSKGGSVLVGVRGYELELVRIEAGWNRSQFLRWLREQPYGTGPRTFQGIRDVESSSIVKPRMVAIWRNFIGEEVFDQLLEVVRAAPKNPRRRQRLLYGDRGDE